MLNGTENGRLVRGCIVYNGGDIDRVEPWTLVRVTDRSFILKSPKGTVTKRFGRQAPCLFIEKKEAVKYVEAYLKRHLKLSEKEVKFWGKLLGNFRKTYSIGSSRKKTYDVKKIKQLLGARKRDHQWIRELHIACGLEGYVALTYQLEQLAEAIVKGKPLPKIEKRRIGKS